nr:hypothetical protein [Tanacetum cinerariifolium]
EDPPVDPPEVPMADNRTMAKLLQAPTEGYEDAIVIPKIAANNFELKHDLINLVQNKQFFGHDKEDMHAHIHISSEVSDLKDLVRAFLLDKKNQSSDPVSSSTPAPFKAIEPNCVTCSGTHSYQSCPATSGNVYRDNIQEYVSQAPAANYNQGNTGFRPQMVNQPPAYQAPAYQAPIPRILSVTQTDFKSYIKANDVVLRNMQSQGQGPGTLPSNTITNPKEYLKGITTRSGAAYQGPPIPTQSKVVKQGTEVTKDQVVPIPYPSRHDNERHRDQANKQIEKFYEISKEMSFKISFTDALIIMTKFASTLKALIGNKEKLSKMARTSMNEHCLVVILNKLPRKLGDPGKFLIPCEFPGMDECLALADLGACINLMPLFVWKGLSLLLHDPFISSKVGPARSSGVNVSTLSRLIRKLENSRGALIEAYESDKIILDIYGEIVTLKRHRDHDADKDEKSSAGPDRGSKRRREGKEPKSASAPKEKATRSAGKSKQGSKFRQASAIESALTEEPMQTTFQMERPSHPEFDTGAEDQPIVQSSQHPEWNLYKALVKAYESDNIILDTYRETVMLKRIHDGDADKDEEPSAGPDQGSKRHRVGNEPVSAKAPIETATRSADKKT